MLSRSNLLAIIKVYAETKYLVKNSFLFPTMLSKIADKALFNPADFDYYR